jgi:hypothetical protein
VAPPNDAAPQTLFFANLPHGASRASRTASRLFPGSLKYSQNIAVNGAQEWLTTRPEGSSVAQIEGNLPRGDARSVLLNPPCKLIG